MNDELSKKNGKGSEDRPEFDVEEVKRLIEAQAAKDRERAARYLDEITLFLVKLIRDRDVADQAVVLLKERVPWPRVRSKARS